MCVNGCWSNPYPSINDAWINKLANGQLFMFYRPVLGHKKGASTSFCSKFDSIHESGFLKLINLTSSPRPFSYPECFDFFFNKCWDYHRISWTLILWTHFWYNEFRAIFLSEMSPLPEKKMTSKPIILAAQRDVFLTCSLHSNLFSGPPNFCAWFCSPFFTELHLCH